MDNIKDYVTYPKKIKHYDTSKRPMRQTKFAAGVMYLLSKALMPRQVQGYKIDKINTENLKPPYILLCNHHTFVDFQINCIATYPHRVNNIATVEAFYLRAALIEWLGCICKRKFTTDLSLVRASYKVLKEYGDVLCMYPEAKYAPVGTTAILPDSLGKLIKKCKVPVATLLYHGNYLMTPFWDFYRKRKVPLYAEMKQILTAEEVEKLSAEEINAIVRKAMEYDEYRWQKEQGIKVTEDFRAEGLHKVLYQCPECKTEYEMNSKGTEIFCEHCGKRWEMTELGELKAQSGETYFSHIPDWFEWERSEVRRQLEEGTYSFSNDVRVYSLPWTRSFVYLGDAHLTHDAENGFVLEGEYNGEKYRIHRTPQSMYSLHVEYDYCHIEKDDCIDISTKDDSFFCYPSQKNCITKLSFATEEIYKMIQEKKNKNNYNE